MICYFDLLFVSRDLRFILFDLDRTRDMKLEILNIGYLILERNVELFIEVLDRTEGR